MTEKSQTQIDLAAAEGRRDTAAAALRAGELQHAAAQDALAAIVPGNYKADQAKEYREARRKAEKVLADRADDAAFLADVLRRVEVQVAELQRQAAVEAYDAKVNARVAAIGAVPVNVEALSAVIEPATSAILALVAASQASNAAGTVLCKHGGTVEQLRGDDADVVNLALRVREQLAEGSLSDKLTALATVAEYIEGADERAAARARAAAERDRERAQVEHQAALRGDRGPAAMKAAQEQSREEARRFYGERATQGMGTMPKASPEVREYFRQAGIDGEEV